MSKVFKKHFENWARRTFKFERGIEELPSKLSYFKKNKDFTDGLILHRFPRKELRYFLRLECPTERPLDARGPKYYEVIKAAKRLRYYMNIPESFVCKSCSKRETCKFRDQVPPKKDTSVHDLLLVLNGLYDYNKLLYPETGSQEPVENEVEQGEPFAESEEPEQTQEKQKEPTEENPDHPEIEMKDRYTFKMWTSAMNVTDTLYPVMDDILNRRSIASREFINAYVAARKENIEEKRGPKVDVSEEEEEDLEEDEEFRVPQRRKERPETAKKFNGQKKKQQFEDQEEFERPQRRKNERFESTKRSGSQKKGYPVRDEEKSERLQERKNAKFEPFERPVQLNKQISEKHEVLERPHRRSNERSEYAKKPDFQKKKQFIEEEEESEKPQKRGPERFESAGRSTDKRRPSPRRMNSKKRREEESE